MVQNGPKWFQMVQNGEKWSKCSKWSNWSKMVEMAKKGQNGQKWSKALKLLVLHNIICNNKKRKSNGKFAPCYIIQVAIHFSKSKRDPDKM